MAYNTVSILRDKDEVPIPQYYDEVEGVFKPLTETQKVTDSGVEVKVQAVTDRLDQTLNTRSGMEYYGATVNERPSASNVPVGATYMAVNSSEVWQSNGSSWVVME